MVEQTVLPFKLDETKDSIISHAGLGLFGEFACGVNFSEVVDSELPAPGSPRGYNPSRFVFPLVLMLNGGGRALEDLREIDADTPLKELLGLDRIPSTDAVGDWLRRTGSGGGFSGLRRVNQHLLNLALRQDDRTDYTLDIDATLIEADKDSAACTYKGFKGYAPLVGHLAENGLVLLDEFREGNDSPQSRNLEFLKSCVARMPEGKRIARFRADSASYQARIIDYCVEEGIEFAIGADRDEGVLKSISGVEEWREYGDGLIGETSHSMNNSRNSFRLVVIKRPSQQSLFVESSPRITAIATHMEGTAEEVAAFYNQRGECSENNLKELKIGIGTERLPCSDFYGNAAFFRIGVLAYNLFMLFKSSALPQGWSRFQVRTVRWKLYDIAGKIVYHGNRLWLKVSRYWLDLFHDIRKWNYAFSLG